jgi:glutamyl-tRNA synthetase
MLTSGKPLLPPIGRLAPSPTGPLHLGHARTFLLAWWDLRSRGGSVLLRLEDLDADRAHPQWADSILRDLQWLGLDWDGEVLVQSKRKQAIVEVALQLAAAAKAYPCVCTRGELRIASAPHAEDTEPRYAGTCRGRYTSVSSATAATGRAAGLRFVVPPGPTTFEDRLLGTVTRDVQAEVGDFLILRRDGTPSYQLAVVVDDAAQGVTDVHRGADLLDSTPRQWHLQDALGLPHPRWMHLPLVVDPEGRRLAKRSDSLGLQALRARGVDPRGIVSWAARSAGLPCDALLTATEALALWDPQRLSSTETRVDPRRIEAEMGGGPVGL